MVDSHKIIPVTMPAGLKPCPICARTAQMAYKPFCSRRCADVDLGRWLKGSYVIPGESVEEAETGLQQKDDEA